MLVQELELAARVLRLPPRRATRDGRCLYGWGCPPLSGCSGAVELALPSRNRPNQADSFLPKSVVFCGTWHARVGTRPVQKNGGNRCDSRLERFGNQAVILVRDDPNSSGLSLESRTAPVRQNLHEKCCHRAAGASRPGPAQYGTRI